MADFDPSTAPARGYARAPAGVELGPRSYAIEYTAGEGMAGYTEGDVLLVDPDQPVCRGDTVIIWFKGAPAATVKRLALALPPADLVDSSEVEAMLVCEQDTPRRRMMASMSKVERVHKVVGKAEPEVRHE